VSCPKFRQLCGNGSVGSIGLRARLSASVGGKSADPPAVVCIVESRLSFGNFGFQLGYADFLVALSLVARISGGLKF